MSMIGGDATNYREAVLRRLVTPESLTVSQGGHVYGGNADFTLDKSASRVATIG